METSHSDIKELIAQYLVGNLRASPSIGNGSIVTLPIKTVDDRWVSVVIEEKNGYFLVHDGGKTDSELFSQGIKMSDDVEQFNASVAAKYRVKIESGIIQKICQWSELAETLLAVAEAAAVMTAQLVSQLVELETQAVRGSVSEALYLWKPEDFEIEENPTIEGRFSPYTLDFIARAQSQLHRTTAINILPRSHSSERAFKYGFMVLDLKGVPSYKDLAYLAVMLGAEKWSEPSRQLVNRIADKTMEVTPDTQGQVESHIRQLWTTLRAAPPEPSML